MNDYAKFYQPVLKHYNPIYNKGGSKHLQLRKISNRQTKRKRKSNQKSKRRKYI